jgi:hypothetical protein
MQTFEAARPQLSSTSFSTDDLLKGPPQIYGNPQNYLASAVDSPYNTNEKGIEDQSSRFRRSNPHRKFSKKWWGTSWDMAVEDGKWPRIIYFSFGAILIIIWIVVMLIFANEEVKYERANQAGTSTKTGSMRLPGEVCSASLRIYLGLIIHRCL